jgi:uncharacterized damage-inducible protein DinB
VTHLSKLIRHCTWANQVWIETIEKDTPDDSYLIRTMSHILLAEQVWLQRITHDELNRDVWKTLPLVDIQTLQARHTDRYASLLDGDLDQVVSYQRFTGERYRSSVADILMHLVTHGAHHRGQMATYTSGLGLTPPNADFIHFCIARNL